MTELTNGALIFQVAAEAGAARAADRPESWFPEAAAAASAAVRG